MAKSQLGLYWGKDIFCFVDTTNQSAAKFAAIPITSSSGSFEYEDLPEGLRLTKLLEKAFIDYQFSTREIQLCLPTKELIFRSFVIPWMQPEEVSSVVEFEATKYMPLKLDELYYTFHAYPFEENNLKNLQILFMAIRRETLDKYTGILQHTNIRIETIEPAAISLIRLLGRQHEIPHKCATAVIELDQDASRIVIIDNDVVQFIRESPMAFKRDSPQQTTTRLITDLRVSYNFFIRQNATAKLKKIILVSLQKEEEITKAIADDFDIPVANVIAAKLMKRADIPHVGLLSAYGTALKGIKIQSKDFNLHEQVSGRVMSQPSFMLDLKRIQTLAVSVLASMAIVFSSMFFSRNIAVTQQARLEENEKKLGPFLSMEKPEIEKMTKSLQERLRQYQHVRTDSDLAVYLYRIPALMPYGMWLKSLKIGYQDVPPERGQTTDTASKVQQRFIELQGYVYQENINEQFLLINTFYSQLKEDDGIKGVFAKFDLKTRQEELNRFNVSSFIVSCK